MGDHVDGILKVEVILLGDLGSSGMRAVRVKLRYPDAPEWADPGFQTTIVAAHPATDPIRWEVPMMDRRKTGYEVMLEWFPETGERIETSPVMTDAETLLIDPSHPEEVL